MIRSEPIIGIDGNEANLANRVGVNTYAFEVLKNISLLEDTWNEKLKIQVFLKNPPLPHMPKETKSFEYKVLLGGGQWILKTLTPHLFTTNHKPSVFWTPSHYIPPFALMPRVCSIMDLGYLEFPEQFKKYDYWQLRLWTAWSIRYSTKILAISATTRKDIIERYSLAQNKIETTLLGYDKETYPPKITKTQVKKVLDTYSIGQEYVLFMSTLKPSKNIEGLLGAWSLIEKRFPKIKLVVAGKKGWLFDSIFKKLQYLKLENRVVFTDFVVEENKSVLISNAKVFVLPSFWEGFGLDVVSSMACGVPVVVSDRGSLPEVVGDAGIVVNADSSEDIARALEKVLLTNSKEYRKLGELGKCRAERFGWVKTAQQTLEVLMGLL